MTGGSGVLGRALLRPARAAGHDVIAPSHDELDLFDPGALASALGEIDAVLHLATRIPAPERRSDPGAWAENDRLRAEATGLLVDAAIAAGTARFVFPSVTFVYPDPERADETRPLHPTDVAPTVRSAIVAERAVERFAATGRAGVVLRLGLLVGPGSGVDAPPPGAPGTLAVGDAGGALLLSLQAPSGTYNVVADGGPISHERFTRATGWRPTAHGLVAPAPLHR